MECSSRIRIRRPPNPIRTTSSALSCGNTKNSIRKGARVDLTLPQQYVRTRTSQRLADRLIWAGLGRVPKRRRDLPTIVVEFRLGPAPRPAARLPRQAEGVPGSAHPGILDHRPLPAHLDRHPQPIRRRGRNWYAARRKFIPPLCLPGFELSLAALFAAADRGAQAD